MNKREEEDILKQMNENRINGNNSDIDRCPGCGRHCAVDALSCGRGRAIMAGVGQLEHSERGEHEHPGHEEQEHRRRERGEHEHPGRGEHDRRGRRERGRREGAKPDCTGNPGFSFEKDESLYGLMRRCGHFLYQKRGGQGQRRILTILQERGSMQQRELQEYLGIQPGSMSELIGKLEQKGFLKRTSAEEDRRSRILTLTDQGREMAGPGQEEQELFGILSEDEQEQLKTLLAKLLETWESRYGR